jgi:hypothetical protein
MKKRFSFKAKTFCIFPMTNLKFLFSKHKRKWTMKFYMKLIESVKKRQFEPNFKNKKYFKNNLGWWIRLLPNIKTKFHNDTINNGLQNYVKTNRRIVYKLSWWVWFYRLVLYCKIPVSMRHLFRIFPFLNDNKEASWFEQKFREKLVI